MSKLEKAPGVIAIGLLVVATAFGISLDRSNNKTIENPQTSDVTHVEGSYTQLHDSYNCTQDCSGHNAGYDWAKEHNICDTEYSNGNSESFNDGVRQRAYDDCYYSDGENPL